MFDLDLAKVCKSNYMLADVAIVDIYAAWYMLLKLNPKLPLVDETLARIYFGEYGVNLEGLSTKTVMAMATEYQSKIRFFYQRCLVQRLTDIVDRFGKICYDPRLEHHITLPAAAKPHFEGIVRTFNPGVVNENEKVIHLADGLVGSLTVNQAYNATSARNGIVYGEPDSGFVVSCRDFATYAEMVRKAVANLYRPSGGLNETHEDWGTKFRRIVNYIKVLVYMALHDVTFINHHEIWVRETIHSRDFLYGCPFIVMDSPEMLFKLAVQYMYTSYNLARVSKAVKNAVEPYGGIAMRHAMCLLHKTNAKLDLTDVPGSRETETFRFLCCQEFIERSDEKLKGATPDNVVPDEADIEGSEA